MCLRAARPQPDEGGIIQTLTDVYSVRLLARLGKTLNRLPKDVLRLPGKTLAYSRRCLLLVYRLGQLI